MYSVKKFNDASMMTSKHARSGLSYLHVLEERCFIGSCSNNRTEQETRGREREGLKALIFVVLA
jgi:hypothetical protein